MNATLKPCSYPACPQLCATGSRCIEHMRVQRRLSDYRRLDDPRIALATRIRNGTRWRILRRLLVARNPMCCDPLGIHQGDTSLTQSIHHIEGLADAPHRAYEVANTAPVCARCHITVEHKERAGECTAQLFLGKECVAGVTCT